MSACRTRSCQVVAGVVVMLALAACGSGARQDANEPSGYFRVAVTRATFPPVQKLASHTRLVLVVRNIGRRPVPNLAITICNVSCSFAAPRGQGSSAAAFSHNIGQPYVANPSRPIWIVDRPPGPCTYSCQNGGQGAYVTAYSNTWALGHKLAPGASARFVWGVTAVWAGRHTVAWQVAAGLNGKAKAVLADGTRPRGTFTVFVSSRPQQSYVNNQGKIVVVPPGKKG
ncbi:MAG: hypothetical protein ACLPV4_17000 [Solirubrobacteraceae bacterium]